MLCFSDVSSKILYDTKKAEGELLTLINSTISHEMRNPLNSIINQCKILYQLGINITGMLKDVKPDISEEQWLEIMENEEEVEASTKIMTTSSNLLLLNVEDILGYAQLQAGRFVQVIKKMNVKKMVNEIVSIQQYQAEAKGITMKTVFAGFPAKASSRWTRDYYDSIPENELDFNIDCDEKRLKQILINLQSNALKFTREGGIVTILV